MWRKRIVWVAVALAWAAPLAGQQVPPRLMSLHPAPQVIPSSTLPKVGRRPSTLLERFGWGAVTAMIAVGATHQAYNRDMPFAAACLSYAAGSALGVGLVTHAREGMNERGILLGATAGTGLGVGLMALAGINADRESDPPVIPVILYLVAVPLGASIGHRYF